MLDAGVGNNNSFDQKSGQDSKRGSFDVSVELDEKDNYATIFKNRLQNAKFTEMDTTLVNVEPTYGVRFQPQRDPNEPIDTSFRHEESTDNPVSSQNETDEQGKINKMMPAIDLEKVKRN